MNSSRSTQRPTPSLKAWLFTALMAALGIFTATLVTNWIGASTLWLSAVG